LGGRRDDAAERLDHWRSQVRGQLGRLVEAARSLPTRMERHRHDAVGVSQQVGSVLSHHLNYCFRTSQQRSNILISRRNSQ